MFSGMMMGMETHRPFQIHHRRRGPRLWVQMVLAVIAAIGLAAVLNLFVFQSYYVDGESMAPTLHSNDRLIISKVERTWSLMKRDGYIPQRGHIVVIDGEASPTTAASAPHLIKRVVGIPGDRIVISKGTVTLYSAEYPSGTNLDTLLGLTLDRTYSNETISVTIPDNSVYVLGDNRAEGGSYDSRAFGPVSNEFLVGRLWARILPLNHERVF